MRQNRLKKTFLHNVSKNIKCSKKDKKEYLEFISVSLDDFLYEHQNADYEQICEEFGRPEKLAQDALENMKIKSIKKPISIRKIIIIASAIMISIIAIGMIITLVDAHKSYYGYGTYDDIYISSVQITNQSLLKEGN